MSMVRSRIEGAGIKNILVTSDGGQVVSSSVVKSNPFPRMDCERFNCMVCWEGPSGGKCAKSGACYTIKCNRPPCRVISEGEGDRACDLQVPMAQYAGKTARTPYTRGSRHLELYTGSVNERSKSFMWRHCVGTHGGVLGDHGGRGDFKMDIISHHRDPLTRVLKEAIEIQNLEN